MWVREKLRKRPSVASEIEAIKKELHKALQAREVFDSIKNFIESSPRVILTYTGPFSSPARYAALALASITMKESLWMHPQDLLYYKAPYDEGRESGIIIFASSEGLNTLNLLTDQLTWTGHKVLVIAQHRIPDELAYKLRDEKLFELETGKWLLITHLLTGIAIGKLAGGGALRRGRLVNEFTNIIPVIDDLVDTYEEVIDSLVDFLKEPVVITATPTMWGIGEFLTYSGINVDAVLTAPEAAAALAKKIGRLLIIGTDVEEFSMKQLRSLSLTSSVKVFDFRLRTDPLTSPIYGLILAHLLTLG